MTSVGYDCFHSVLEIEFKNRRVVEFFEVPPDCFTDFMRTPLKDEFFEHRIRNGGFQSHPLN